MAYKPDEIESIFKEICRQISEDGMSLRSVLKPSDMPDAVTFYKWLDDDAEKIKQYARACNARTDYFADEILGISDERNADAWVSDTGETKIDGMAIQRSKLMVDTRKWLMSKMNPKKYGDKVDITSKGGKINSDIYQVREVIVDKSDET